MSFLRGPMRKHLNGHKDLTMDKPVLKSIDPDFVWVPLCNGAAPCSSTVEIGDEVKVGTRIGERNDHFYLPIFSPVSGKVVGIEKFLGSGMTQIEHLKIENDHKHEKVRAFAEFDYEAASQEELLEFVKNAGMAGLGGAGFPTYVKYLKPENVKNFIINAVECEPYLTADYKNIEENMDLLKVGVLALFKLSKAEKGCVAIKEDKEAQIAALEAAFAGTPIEIVKVPNVYPMGWERVLVFEVTGRRYDRLPMEAGCILNNASTAIALGNAIVNGMPITHKYVTVSGDAINNPQNVLVPVGTKVCEIIEAIGGYKAGVEEALMIAGGPMMGRTVPNDQFVIQLPTNGLTVLEDKPIEQVACFRCGRCTENCPAGLEPVSIATAVNSFDYEALPRLRVLDCIECGLCTWTCPSKILVTENVRKGKRLLQTRMKQQQAAQGGKK